ncbi:unnamed protein product [Rhodiola kirilowii]
MGRVHIIVAALAMLLMAASFDAMAETTVFADKVPAAARESVYYPQGCRCCLFRYRPRIECISVCCNQDLAKCCV